MIDRTPWAQKRAKTLRSFVKNQGEELRPKVRQVNCHRRDRQQVLTAARINKDAYLSLPKVEPGKPASLKEKVPEKVDALYFEMSLNYERVQSLEVDNRSVFSRLFRGQKDVADEYRLRGR